MTFKKLLAVMVLLSVILGVDAKKNRSPRKTEKLYRKAGKWQRKLRDVWALLGVKPFLVQPGEEGDECVLKSKITVDDAADKGDYMLKSTVETDYVLKGADVFTQADIDANYVLKTCGSPPAGKQFKACTGGTCTEDTVCGDPTGQTDCATKCFEDFVGKPLGESCSEAAECASGVCFLGGCVTAQTCAEGKMALGTTCGGGSVDASGSPSCAGVACTEDDFADASSVCCEEWVGI